MELDPALAFAGLLVGLTVGLTGMGGGALMTPMLVLFFKVDPLVAVGSDLVVSLLMKPVGGLVHMRRGTVRKDITLWLIAGSVPAAFAGTIVLKLLGAENVEPLIKQAIGITLLASAGSMILRHQLAWSQDASAQAHPELRRLPTIAIGVLGGLLVGLTSVGSGSLIIVLLMLTYPRLASSQLVGTDLVQAVPLVGAAALGHLLFGEVSFGLTGSLLIGAMPGVYAGAQFSSRSSPKVVRPVLFVVLVSTGLKLVQVV